MWRLSILLFLLVPLAGCDKEQPHPSQQAIERAEKLADEAIQQTLDLQRLRDIDKMKFDAESAEMQTAWAASIRRRP